jgi:hypothetical protein
MQRLKGVVRKKSGSIPGGDKGSICTTNCLLVVCVTCQAYVVEVAGELHREVRRYV